MALIKKIFNFIKGKKYIYGILLAILVVLLIFVFKNGEDMAGTITVSRSDFVDKVSISGKVVASEEVELGFKNGGRITGVFYSVGEGLGGKKTVKEGTIIAKLDTKDAEQSLREAEIGLESAKLSLAKLKLENSTENLNTDLQKAYDDGFTGVSNALLDFSTTISNLKDILSENNLSDNAARMSGNTAVSYRDKAEELYYDAKIAFEKNRKDFRLLSRNSPKNEIEKIINDVYETSRIFSDAIKNTKNLVDYLSDDSNDPSGYVSSKNSLAEYANTVNGHLAVLLSAKNDIKSYKDVFSSTDLDIGDAILTIKQKENDLWNAKNELADYFIKAPFDGVITKVDAKIGEIASPDMPLVTIMSDGVFQIESFVPEVSIAKIKMGDEAIVTLDAYGDGVLFNAKVISIDPAETIRDGVSTYKIKLQFNVADERIKSGMTASVSIVTFSKPGVIVVPGGVVFEKDGKKMVQVKNNVGEIEEREVILGSVSSLGQAEVVSGLSVDEMVVLNPEIK